MFEKVSVIPLYLSFLKMSDPKKDLSWEWQIYIGTNFDKAYSSAFEALRETLPPDGGTVRAFVREYHIHPDGKVAYIAQMPDVKL